MSRSQSWQHERLSVNVPLNVMAVHDPGDTQQRQDAGSGRGVSVRWVRPSDLAIRVAERGAAAALAAHLAAHRRTRAAARARLAGTPRGRQGRLAPPSAFGSAGQTEHAAARRPPLSR